MAEMPSHTAHGECLHSGIPLQRWAERCLEWEACRFPKQYSELKRHRQILVFLYETAGRRSCHLVSRKDLRISHHITAE